MCNCPDTAIDPKNLLAQDKKRLILLSFPILHVHVHVHHQVSNGLFPTTVTILIVIQLYNCLMHFFITRQNILGLITNRCSGKEPVVPFKATQGCVSTDSFASLSSSDNCRKFLLLDKSNYCVRPMANYVELMNVP